MSRFLIALIVGATITAGVSTSRRRHVHCLARAPNGASGKAFGIILGRAQSIALRRCIHRGGGAGCTTAWCRPSQDFPGLPRRPSPQSNPTALVPLY